jgi:hypothetical protein
MTTSSIHEANLCTLYRTTSSQNLKKVLCQVPKDRTTALVLFLIGISFIGTGLYLLLGGVGTISSLSMGSMSLIAGSGIFFASNFFFFKALYFVKKKF